MQKIPRAFSLLLIALLSWLAATMPDGVVYAEERDGAISVYVGRYTRDTLIQTFTDTFDLNFDDRDYVGVIAYSRVFRNPSTSRSWELEGQIGRHFSGQDHLETNLAVFHRWRRFPWSDYVGTTLAIGSGLSYAFEDPPLEEANPSNDGTTGLQFYLGFDATLAPPSWERLSILFRIHHRSTVAGLFGNVDSGSNYLTAGIRYEF